jgi:hypothetical protein
MITNVTRFACALLTCLSAVGCGSDDPAPPPTPPDDTLNFAKVTKEVLNESNCGGPLCHTATAAGFKLGSNDALYAELVGQMAAGSECANKGHIRVVAGDSASSLLYLKLTAPPCGDKMPQDPAMLAAEKIDLVKQWIDEGAVK